VIVAHVNKMGIVLQYTLSENLSHEDWESLLDDLKSHYIPSFYQFGKRSYADFSGAGEEFTGKVRVVIYFTPKTVAIDEAIGVLRKRGVEVLDTREDHPEP
jgi:hypothetical protein